MPEFDPTAIDIEFNPHQQRMRGVAFYGDTHFDVPYMSEVKGAINLFQGGCRNMLTLPRNIEHLVSLYPWEAYDVMHDLESRLEVRMYDSVNDGPDMEQVVQVATWVNACRKQGPTLVHCQAGLNRSGLVSAIALILDGAAPDEAITMLRQSRSPAVLCNPNFEKMVREFIPDSPTS
jgi:protein-tyrosine phosphatase